jgi:hypothetical protein
MMVLFFHASRMALTVFDPYLSSRPLAQALLNSPKGQLIVDGAYYPFSSVIFYADQTALLLNGRTNNLEYGSYAPGAPQIFIDDEAFLRRWQGGSRYYLVADTTQVKHLQQLAGAENLFEVAAAGGKFLFSNQPVKRPEGTQFRGSLQDLW